MSQQAKRSRSEGLHVPSDGTAGLRKFLQSIMPNRPFEDYSPTLTIATDLETTLKCAMSGINAFQSYTSTDVIRGLMKKFDSKSVKGFTDGHLQIGMWVMDEDHKRLPNREWFFLLPSEWACLAKHYSEVKGVDDEEAREYMKVWSHGQKTEELRRRAKQTMEDGLLEEARLRVKEREDVVEMYEALVKSGSNFKLAEDRMVRDDYLDLVALKQHAEDVIGWSCEATQGGSD